MQLEKVLKAVANQRRLQILALLKRKRQASVMEIADSIKLSMRATSKHLHILLTSDIVQKEQQGPYAIYWLNSRLPPLIRQILTQL